MGALLWAIPVLLCVCSISALLEEDGILVRDEGKGLQIVSTWTLLVTVKQPEPAWLLKRLPQVREFARGFEGLVSNETIQDWHTRLDMIENSLLASKSYELSPLYSSNFSYHRSRRGLLDGVSKLGKWLFGFATVEDVEKMGKLLAHLHSDDVSVTHSMEQLITIVNKTVEAVNKQGRRVHTYAKHLRTVEVAVQELQAAARGTQARLQVLEVTNKLGLVLNELEAVHRYWEKDCETYLRQLRALQRGSLTTDLLKPGQLASILWQQETQLSTRAMPVYWYYSNVKVSLLMWKGTEFVYKAELPTVNSETYVLYSLITIPVYTGVNNVWRKVIDLPTKVGWNSRRGGTIETDQCFGKNPVVCPPAVHHRHGRCITGILAGKKADLDQCSMTVFSDVREDIALKIDVNTYLISSRNHSLVRLHCDGKPETRARVDRVKVYTIDAGCIMETDSWRLTGEHRRVLTRDYVRETHAVKSFNLGFHFEELEDFRRVRKLVVHEPVVVRAGDLKALYIRPATLPRKTLVVSSSLTSSLFLLAILSLGLCYCSRKRRALCFKRRRSQARQAVRMANIPRPPLTPTNRTLLRTQSLCDHNPWYAKGRRGRHAGTLPTVESYMEAVSSVDMARTHSLRPTIAPRGERRVSSEMDEGSLGDSPLHSYMGRSDSPGPQRTTVA